MQKLVTRSLTYLLFTLLFAACLPQEKTTQCGSNEAFDSKQRKCVASLGVSKNTLSIASISPSSSYVISSSDPSKSHAITVSNPYNYDYQIKWTLTYPNNTTLTLGTGLGITFTPTFSAGSYVMEVQLFDGDGTQLIDSRSWTVNIIDELKPYITANTATPLTTTTTSTNSTITADNSNPSAISNVNYQWYVNGTAVPGENGIFSGTIQSLSFNYDPTNSTSYYAGAGIYNVQLQLTENISNSIYDIYTWTIQNNLPAFANVSLGTSSFGTTTPSSAAIITAIDETNISSNGFLYDVDGDTNLDSVDFCVKVDDITGHGTAPNDGVYVDFLIDGVAIPVAVDQKLLLSNQSYCLQNFNNYFYNIPASIAQESHVISAIVYDKYPGTSPLPNYNGYIELAKYDWNIRVRQKNTAPTIQIDTTNTNIACNAIGSGAGDSTVYASKGCTITQDTSFDIAITVSDEDYNPYDYASEYAKFRVEYFINGTLIDGTHSLSSSDCYEDFSETNSATRYICSLTINSYDTNGPVDTSGLSYTLTAKVTDADSPFVTPDTQESNSVSWQISSVTPVNSGIDIVQFAGDDATRIANPTYSYISTQAAPGIGLDLDNVAGAASEGDAISFHVSINDPERDSHTISIDRCSDITCSTGIVSGIITSSVISSDSTNPRVSSLNYQIPEDTITGTARGSAFYRFRVTDTPGGASNTTNTIVEIIINNNNPDPIIDMLTTPTNANPDQGVPLVAVTGFPLTIDPGPIADASITDGHTIKYQWAIDVNNTGNYTIIDGATERVLLWTPGSEIDFLNQTSTNVELKLCVGDDGVDAAGTSKDPFNATNCKYPTLDTGDWSVSVFSNAVSGSSFVENNISHTSLSQIATWVDPSSVSPLAKYIAYVSQDKDIIVEKHVISSTGAKNGSTDIAGVNELKAIEFTALSSGASTGVTNLSMAGDTANGSLYISYLAPVAGTDYLHVRRIDIGTGKTGLTHQGKFGFDPGYNDLLDNVTPGVDASEAIDGNGKLTITFNSVTAASTITFSSLNRGTSTFVLGTDFCNPMPTACVTTTDAATSFAAAIDASTEEEVQGFTAGAVANVVTFEGIVQDDFLEQDESASALGQIVVNQNTGKWQLPLIDNAPGLPDKDKISIFSGNLGIRLIDSAASKTAITTTVRSQEVTNDIDINNGNLLIATKGLLTGEIALYEIDTSNSVIDANTDIFGDVSVSDIKIKIGQTAANRVGYLTGINGNDRLAFNSVPVSGGNFDFSDFTTSLDLDSSFPLLQSFVNYDISPGTAENDLFIGMIDKVNTDAYLLKVEGSTPIINCTFDGSSNTNYTTMCQKIQSVSTDIALDMPVALSHAVENVTLGTAGATASENEKDIIFYVFHKDYDGIADTNVDTSPDTYQALPIGSIINIEGNALTVDDSGTANIGINYNLPYVAP